MGKKKRIQKRYVLPEKLNWNVEFYRDLLSGDGFIISEQAEVSLDGKKERALYGAQSPLYGSIPQDEQAYIERYRCQCGTFKGKNFEGEICPICGTPIEFKDSNIKMTGWIVLGKSDNLKKPRENFVINPLYYQKLCSALGKTIFPDIISAKYKVGKNGRRTRATEEDLDTPPSSIYAYIGIDAFYDNYDEILTYFKTTSRKSKAKSIDLLIKDKSAVFVSHIPILSALLRPQSITQDTFYYKSIDKIVNTLFSLSENIKKCVDVERDDILARIQKKVNDMWNIHFDTINSKEGWIRDQLLGGSLNFTARNVICPNPELNDNEVILSYNTFLQMYKFKIIHYIMVSYGIRLAEANQRWERAAAIFDPGVYQIMNYILEKENVRLLINRNPTLNFYSMLLMKIKYIRPDSDDFTLAIPLSILPGLNADQLSRSERAVMRSLVLCERLTSGVTTCCC